MQFRVLSRENDLSSIIISLLNAGFKVKEIVPCKVYNKDSKEYLDIPGYFIGAKGTVDMHESLRKSWGEVKVGGIPTIFPYK